MADIRVDLHPEDVNRAIADAIVRSTLGETIVKMTNDYVKGLSNSWDNPVKKVVEAEVRALIVNLVQDRAEVIKAEVTKQLADDMVTKLVAAAVDKFTKSIY